MVVAPREPRFHPVSMLPVIAGLIEGGLEGGRKIHESFKQTHDRPHLLDDETVSRAISYHIEALAFVDLYEEQLRRWASGSLTAAQASEVARLQGLIEPLRRLHTEGLALARALCADTIEKVMSRLSDEELGLMAVLSALGGRRSNGR